MIINIKTRTFSYERKTKQRDCIFQALEEAGRPLSPQEILELSKIKISGIGIATVYRTIKSSANKKISEVLSAGSTVRYEVNAKDHHHHFWCRICDRVFKGKVVQVIKLFTSQRI